MKKLLVLYRFFIDERSHEFEKAYREHKGNLEQIAGHLSEMLVRSTLDPTSYLIVSTWQAEAFFSWLQSPSHDTMVQLLNMYKRGVAEVSKYNIILDTFQHK